MPRPSQLPRCLPVSLIRVARTPEGCQSKRFAPVRRMTWRNRHSSGLVAFPAAQRIEGDRKGLSRSIADTHESIRIRYLPIRNRQPVAGLFSPSLGRRADTQSSSFQKLRSGTQVCAITPPPCALRRSSLRVARIPAHWRHRRQRRYCRRIVSTPAHRPPSPGCPARRA